MKILLLRSLASRLAALLFLGLVPVFSLLLYILYEQYASQKQNARENAVRLVRVLNAAHVQTIEDAKSVLKTMAQLPSFREQEGQRCDFLRTEFTQVFPRFLDIMLANSWGKTICSTGLANEFGDVVTRLFFQETLRKRDVATGSYRFDRVAGAPNPVRRCIGNTPCWRRCKGNIAP